MQAVEKEKLLDVHFAGGYLTDLLQHIEEDNGVAINVIVSEYANSQAIHPLDLRKVLVGDLMKGLDSLGVLKIDLTGKLYSAKSAGPPASARRKVDPKVVQVYDVRSLATQKEGRTLSFSVEDLVTVLTTAWEMGQNLSGPPDLKFHEETYLLIVYGDRDQQEVAKSVLEKLQKSQTDLTWEREREQLSEGLHRVFRLISVFARQARESPLNSAEMDAI